jgi:hypothetical protein
LVSPVAGVANDVATGEVVLLAEAAEEALHGDVLGCRALGTARLGWMCIGLAFQLNSVSSKLAGTSPGRGRPPCGSRRWFLSEKLT